MSSVEMQNLSDMDTLASLLSLIRLCLQQQFQISDLEVK